MSTGRFPIRLNNNEDIRINSIVTFTVPDTNNIGLGIVVKTDNTTNTYKVRYIANNEWQNIFPNHAEAIITSDIIYDHTEINITNTNMLYTYDNTNDDLITYLEVLRKLLDPKTLEGLKDFLALPSSQDIISYRRTKAKTKAKTKANQSYTDTNTDTDPGPSAALIDGGYSAKSIRKRYKSRRHKKTNRRHKKSNNRNKKSNRRR